MTDDDLPALTGPVEVVGAGLIGTSIALVCSRLGIEVVLRDTSAENLRTAHGLGRGTRGDGRTTDRSWSWWPCRPPRSATPSSTP